MTTTAFLTPASAADHSSDYYVAPSFSSTGAADRRNSEQAYGGEIALGVRLRDELYIELGGLFDTAAGQGSAADWQTAGLSISLLSYVEPGVYFHPYVFGGISEIQSKSDGNKYTTEAVRFGVGIERAVWSERLLIRSDLGVRQIGLPGAANDEPNFGELQVRFGVVFPFGTTRQDRDGDEDRDGVLNPVDDCRGTPLGIPVDLRGCPFPRMVYVYFPLDSDTLNPEDKLRLDDVNRTAGYGVGQQSYVINIVGGIADVDLGADQRKDLNKRRIEAVLQHLNSRRLWGRDFSLNRRSNRSQLVPEHVLPTAITIRVMGEE